MPFFLTATVSMLIVLGIMVLVHELGHFIAAKAFGVRVEVFSIGFGTRLFGFRRGDTDYRVCLLPLGGYVKMAGELGGDGTVPLNTGNKTGKDEDGPRVLDPGDLNSKPRWQRIIIALAGPVANFLLAFGLMTGLYMMHNEVDRYLSEPAVIDVVKANSAAARAGLEAGDKILQFDVAHDPTWQQVRIRAALDANSTIPVTVERTVNGKSEDVSTHLFIADPTKGQDFSLDEVGLIPRMQNGPMKVTDIVPGFPAAKAGLKPGDKVAALNGVPLHSVMAVIAWLQQQHGQPVTMTILRDGQTQQLTVTPKWGDDGSGQMGYRLGFGVAQPPYNIEQMPFFAALRQSAVINAHYSGYILDVLHRLVTHKTGLQQLSGPIGIARETGEAVQMPGWQPLINLMALISLNLGIMNLLPFPILDGGMITFLVIEEILRHDLKIEIKERIYQVAFVVLILFFAFVMFNDVSKLNLFSKLKP
ncbi:MULTISPECIES: RIP metalloprotease RseP [Acidobacterium]|uniref:Zinc metalloprotease n=1 Tax=Acidobacterium capsulatum (strain ATCC 51196 / DSM 11244 / BCRC 80197 / JCM 7670 / NBRC 15755 / NCIMB 13165 / 161) TaxID=240015 RepID=C1F757_ACIC5|nr:MULTISPECIES: RIP metalloprotease RseP [Acidobacterium]ACO34471.1 peptidase, M50 family [Acidobacterium capsulatum ATCC 51196]HCT60992.1 RIP metalloprotease RseP [Acidobacterium sp.]